VILRGKHWEETGWANWIKDGRQKTYRPSLYTAPVIKLNFLALGSLEESVENRGYINRTEGAIIEALVLKFNVLQVKKDCIGVIAPYRAQIDHLTNLLSSYLGVEINTVDKFQGRENKIILLSFVRSGSMDDSNVHSELLESINRLTVSVTRAQYKFIAIGCTRTLSKIDVTNRLIKYVRKNDMIVSLTKQELQDMSQ